MDLSIRRLFLNGRPVHLTAKLFDILMTLVRNRGEVVTKEELMEEIWPDQFVEESNLTVSMSALRKALGERYRERKYIETIPKRGYRFVARVRESSVESPGHRGPAPSDGLATNKNSAEKTAIPLAVLPLMNESHNPSLEYLSDGLAESFINSLSQIPGLRVLARSTVFHYKGKEIDVLRIGQELNVRALLAGSIRQFDDTLLINVELVDVEDGARLWGARYNCQFPDIFAVQGKIATEVSEKLRLRLTTSERSFLTKRYTENAEAYRHYLKGRFFWSSRSIKGINKAIRYFQKAIALDSNYALACSGLADCYITLAGYGILPPHEIIPRAKEALARAIEIDDTLAEAQASLGLSRLSFDLDWPGAEKAYLKAINLNPNYAAAYQWYADYLAKLGRFDEAVKRINQALELEPLSLMTNKTAGKISFMAREYDKAVVQFLETLEIEPDFGPASGALAYTYALQGKYEQAVAEIQNYINFAVGDYEVSTDVDVMELAPPQKQVIVSQSDPEAIAALGFIYARAGKRDEALELVKGLKALRQRRYVEPHTLATIYIGLEDKDKAFEWLEKSFDDRSNIFSHLKVWPVLDVLRSDPRFRVLYRRAGFTS